MAALAVMAAAVLALLPASAGAATRDWWDPAKDVVRGFTKGPADGKRVERIATSDVRRVEVRLTRGKLAVTVHYRNLVRTGRGTTQQHFTRIRTNEGTDYYVDTRAKPGAWGGRHALYRGGSARSCSRLQHSLDYATDTYRLLVPRGCLSRPSRVRVGHGAVLIVRQDGGGSKQYVDDSRLNGSYAGNDVVLGPRVRVG